MSTSKTWPGGAVNVSPATYSIPAAGELNWQNLSLFLNALGDSAQSTTFQKYAVRKATTSPITVSATSDCAVISQLTVPAAVSVVLPAGANKQYFTIIDGSNDATTNNITITPTGSDTIAGASSLVLSRNSETVTLIYNSSDTDWKIVCRSLGVSAAAVTSAGLVYSTGTALASLAFTSNGNKVAGINNAGNNAELKDFAVGTTGTDFAVAHAAGTITFNLPDAGASARGAITTGTQTIAGAKTVSSKFLVSSGSVTAPSVGFSADDDGSGTGIYRISANSMGFAANGNLVLSYSSSGLLTTTSIASTANIFSVGATTAVGSGGSTSSLQFRANGVVTGGIGVNGTAGQLFAAAAQGDMDIFGVSSGVINFGNGSTIHGIKNNAGIWTLGPSGNTTVASHIIRGDLQINTSTVRGSVSNSGFMGLYCNVRRDGDNSLKAIATGNGYSRLDMSRSSSGTDSVVELITNITAQTAGAAADTASDVIALRVYGRGSVDIKGTTTNDAAPAGYVGEVIAASIARASAVSSVNNTLKTVTSIVLTPGQWMLSAIGAVLANTSTITEFDVFISKTTNAAGGAAPAVPNAAGEVEVFTTRSITNEDMLVIPGIPALVASTATYYLVLAQVSAGNNPTFYGYIQATRVR